MVPGFARTLAAIGGEKEPMLESTIRRSELLANIALGQARLDSNPSRGCIDGRVYVCVEGGRERGESFERQQALGRAQKATPDLGYAFTRDRTLGVRRPLNSIIRDGNQLSVESPRGQ